jgi:hypothetical protein
MSYKYKIREIDKAYFITLTVVDWLMFLASMDNVYQPKRSAYAVTNGGKKGTDYKSAPAGVIIKLGC